MSNGSGSVAFDVVQDGHDGIVGAGQVLPASGVQPGIRLETGELELTASEANAMA